VQRGRSRHLRETRTVNELLEREINALEKYARLTREQDDTFYRTCRNALADEINELRNNNRLYKNDQTTLEAFA
jgi:hypothetical protein